MAHSFQRRSASQINEMLRIDCRFARKRQEYLGCERRIGLDQPIQSYQRQSSHQNFGQCLGRVQRTFHERPKRTDDIARQHDIDNLAAAVMKDAITDCITFYYYEEITMTPPFGDDIA